MYASERTVILTDIQTDTFVAILCTPIGGELKTRRKYRGKRCMIDGRSVQLVGQRKKHQRAVRKNCLKVVHIKKGMKRV